MNSDPSRLDCLIFDCDGTLIDSEPLGHIAMAQELALLGIAEDAGEMETRYRAWPLRDLLDDLQTRHATRLDEALETRWRDRLATLYDRDLRPLDGADAMLAGLPHAKCVASNGPRSKIEHGLRNTGLLRHFGDRLYSAYDIRMWKPDPALFLHAARQMGFAPERCVVVEDSLIGLDAACAAGMHAFWFDPLGLGEDSTGITRFSHLSELPALLRTHRARAA